MTQKPYYSLAARCLLWASLQFIILTVVAMFAYPGGHAHDPSTNSYSFTHNYFSDLGSTKTFSGEQNVLCLILFVTALIGVGTGMIGFAFTTPIYQTEKTGHLLPKVASLMLGLSGCCFVAIAVLPLDLYFREHNFFVRTAFSLLLIYCLAIWYLQIRNSWPRRYILANSLYILTLAVYVLILFKGPSYETVSGLKFQVISQKIIAYTSILNLGYQAVGILRKSNSLTDFSQNQTV